MRPAPGHWDKGASSCSLANRRRERCATPCSRGRDGRNGNGAAPLGDATHLCREQQGAAGRSRVTKRWAAEWVGPLNEPRRKASRGEQSVVSRQKQLEGVRMEDERRGIRDTGAHEGAVRHATRACQGGSAVPSPATGGTTGSATRRLRRDGRLRRHRRASGTRPKRDDRNRKGLQPGSRHVTPVAGGWGSAHPASQTAQTAGDE